jgi:hypothetical protein
MQHSSDLAVFAFAACNFGYFGDLLLDGNGSRAGGNQAQRVVKFADLFFWDSTPFGASPTAVFQNRWGWAH